MAIFGVGPDGLLLVQALLVSILLMTLAWRRATLFAAAISTAHAWMLLVAGPFVLVGCYAGICEFCVKTKLI